MKHEEAWEHLDAYRDNELPPALKAEVEGHVASCRACAAALAERAALGGRIEALSPPRPVDSFVESVLERMDAPRPAPRWLVPAFAAGLAAASLFVAIGLRPISANSGAQSADILWAGENNGSGRLKEITGVEKLDPDQVLSIVLGAS